MSRLRCPHQNHNRNAKHHQVLAGCVVECVGGVCMFARCCSVRLCAVAVPKYRHSFLKNAQKSVALNEQPPPLQQSDQRSRHRMAPNQQPPQRQRKKSQPASQRDDTKPFTRPYYMLATCKPQFRLADVEARCPCVVFAEAMFRAIK